MNDVATSGLSSDFSTVDGGVCDLATGGFSSSDVSVVSGSGKVDLGLSQVAGAAKRKGRKNVRSEGDATAAQPSQCQNIECAELRLLIQSHLAKSATPSPVPVKVKVFKAKRPATELSRKILGLWRELVLELTGSSRIVGKNTIDHARVKKEYDSRLEAIKASYSKPVDVVQSS